MPSKCLNCQLSHQTQLFFNIYICFFKNLSMETKRHLVDKTKNTLLLSSWQSRLSTDVFVDPTATPWLLTGTNYGFTTGKVGSWTHKKIRSLPTRRPNSSVQQKIERYSKICLLESSKMALLTVAWLIIPYHCPGAVILKKRYYEIWLWVGDPGKIKIIWLIYPTNPNYILRFIHNFLIELYMLVWMFWNYLLTHFKTDKLY